jgi:hypothetical protein
MAELTDKQVEMAFKENIVRFPKVEKLPVDPPIAGQNYGLFSFKFLPKPINGVYGFLKFRGSFNDEDQWTRHAKYLIRSVDSKHKIWPFEQGKWMPITTNEEYAKDTLEVAQKDEIKKIFNNQDNDDQKEGKQKVKEVKDRERKLLEESKRTVADTDSLDYYAQKVMSMQQLTSWLDTVRKRKRDMLKAFAMAKADIDKVEKTHPEYVDQVGEKIKTIKREIGLDENAPLDKASLSKTPGL